MRYTQQDLEGVLDFVRDLYDRRGLEDFADRTMGSLLRLAAADRIVYGDFDIERQGARLSMQPSVVKEHDGTVDGAVNGALGGLERGFGNHPLYRFYLQTGDGLAHKTSQVMTKSQFRRYCDGDEFVRQLGARYQMGLFFAAGPSVITAILLARSQRDFAERERALVNRLYPHLVQAFRNTASLNRLSRDVDGLIGMLEGPTSSVVVLAGDGRVMRWTDQGRNWIAQYCRTPFPAQADRLPDCFADWYRRQLALVAQETLSPSPRDPLVVDKAGRQLTVQLIPDHFRDEHLLLLNEKRGDSSWSALGEYGLTPRESEVLAWVAKGKTNAEVGAILQMSDRTVQKHLEHIYQKLGVETRTTATVRALKVLGIGNS
jgi:DNA-binding CsgD family transcriptional regulator